MDNVILKKKLSTYISDKGYLKNLSDEVLYEVLIAWENWTGSSKEFYRSLGFSQKQMASVVGKAKKLKRDGYYGDSGFKPVQVEAHVETSSVAFGQGIEILWSNGRIIRFAQVDQLIDFLKKAA